jgi:hypothetical protein
MSNFKRNSSSFNRGGSSGGSNPPARTGGNNGGGYTSRNSRDRDSRGESGGGGYKFTRLGNLTIPKSVDDDTRDAIMNDLRGNEAIKLSSKIYLPKGVEEIVLRNGDMLLINFRVNERDKDFVVGGISKAND